MPAAREAVLEALSLLNQGKIRVAVCKAPGDWEVQAWVKKAILLYFGITEMKEVHSGDLSYFDKIPTRTDHKEAGIRAVPPAVIRYGAFAEKGVILMPSYVNIGAYVATGTMVDTWATVGSCAQIGKSVHLSGGVGIGGVLEPPQGRPVIIEDGAFLGSRAIVVEGVMIEERAVIGANVTLTASTPIIDVTGPSEVVYKGRVPRDSVVIPGMREKKFAAGTFGVPCALIIGKRKATTDEKTSLNDALRDFEVSV
ncbi:MAG TPA: 2,3,4,5-tetrahydropyridine-2,6-dicarboxylate N-succinyltransferase [Leptospiraceae bacterium]|nr:2,3,4,5-tetrahydropyridine-2,6-dicarboxylate N-succinyltransferase [Leptospiraceae bacterium]